MQGAGIRGEGYYGIYGASATGYAGYFDGQIQVNGPLSATMVLQNSDRYRKANIASVDGPLDSTSHGDAAAPDVELSA